MIIFERRIGIFYYSESKKNFVYEVLRDMLEERCLLERACRDTMYLVDGSTIDFINVPRQCRGKKLTEAYLVDVDMIDVEADVFPVLTFDKNFTNCFIINLKNSQSVLESFAPQTRKTYLNYKNRIKKVLEEGDF